MSFWSCSGVVVFFCHCVFVLITLSLEYNPSSNRQHRAMAGLMLEAQKLRLTGGLTASPIPRSSSRTGGHTLPVVRAAAEPTDKSLDAMRKFSEQYARRSGTYFCVDKGVTSVVIKGLAEHRDSLGTPLCPCRHYDDKRAEVQQGFWNCPCVPMRERKECHCMLFLTEDNDFAGDEQKISMDEIKELTANFSAGGF